MSYSTLQVTNNLKQKLNLIQKGCYDTVAYTAQYDDLLIEIDENYSLLNNEYIVNDGHILLVYND